MPDLDDLIREYCEILDREQRLDARKQALRGEILRTMTERNLMEARSPFGSAQRSPRFKLTPRREPMLRLLTGEDLFPFAQFSPAKVKAVLVPKYGRERLIPMFDIYKSEFVQVRRKPDGR